jgi:competence protein ComEC
MATRLGIRRATGLFLSRVWVAMALLALVTMFVYTTAVTSPDARTRVSFIAASDGDATFIRTAKDERILINGTNEPSVVLSFLGAQLPPWDRRLDLVLATHLDENNLASLNAVLERFHVAGVLEPIAPARAGASYTKWRALLEKKQVAVYAARRGTTARAGEATLEVIYPDDGEVPNAALRLNANGQTFLLAPALRKTDRDKMLQTDTPLDADVAVLPNEIENEWLARAQPTTVIFFSGRNPRNQPTAETLKLLDSVRIFQTHENGNVEFLLDGATLHVVTQKQAATSSE